MNFIITETPTDRFQELSEEIQNHLILLIELQKLFKKETVESIKILNGKS